MLLKIQVFLDAMLRLLGLLHSEILKHYELLKRRGFLTEGNRIISEKTGILRAQEGERY
jgi:hypothetical protein